MAKYINKDALVAEIEKIRAEEMAIFEEQCRSSHEPSASPAVVCMRMEHLRSFINNLEVKEVEESTAADRGVAEEIIINLKRVEQDYHIDLTNEMEWIRNKSQKGVIV